MEKQIVRIGVMNNFDHTQAEFDHIALLEKTWSNSYHYKGIELLPMVNSNAHTVLRADRPAIVTVNPDLEFIPLQGDYSNVKALRVKVWPGQDIQAFNAMGYPTNIPVLLTCMRFNSVFSLNEYIEPKHRSEYSWERSYFRLNKTSWHGIIKAWQGICNNTVKVCDEKRTNCTDCQNCSKLTYGIKATIRSLNLSTSGQGGKCTYNCPDCFAHKLLMGGFPSLNKLSQNSKQKGK